MARNAMGIIIGLTIAFVIKWSILSVNTRLFPLPAGLNPGDVEAMKSYVSALPPTAYIITLFSNFMCTFGGAFVAVKVAESHKKKLAIGIGIFIMLLGIVNLITIPHPTWYIPLDILTYVPGALLGYYLAKPKITRA